MEHARTIPPSGEGSFEPATEFALAGSRGWSRSNHKHIHSVVPPTHFLCKVSSQSQIPATRHDSDRVASSLHSSVRSNVGEENRRACYRTGPHLNSAVTIFRRACAI